MDRVVAISPLWNRVWARRQSILLLVLVATLVTGVAAFLLPVWYRADAELLPPTDDESGLSLGGLLRGVAVSGVKIPNEVTPVEVFAVILKSRTINQQMVDRFQLRALYKKRFMEDAIKELLSHAKFKLTPAGTIQISVEDRDRQRAASMTNAYVELLDRFNREQRMTKGRRTRLFIQGRLAETRRELSQQEQHLADYQANHKTIVLTPQMSSAIEEAAHLNARRTALEVRLGVVRAYSDGSEEEIQIQQELSQLDRQMRALPETGLDLARLVRDVRASEQVLTLLTAQYEDARITEARDVVTVEVLDPAVPPDKKSRPHRITMMAAAFLLSLALGVGYSLLQQEERPPSMVRAVASD
jgi:uncharacterized protein involved in exopolysaccharide biosynthesis